MNRLPRLLSGAGAFLSKVGEWVAGLTFWQFVAFSLLVLIAGGIADSAIFPEEPRPVTVRKKAAHTPAVPSVASAPPPGASTDAKSPADAKDADGNGVGDRV